MCELLPLRLNLVISFRWHWMYQQQLKNFQIMKIKNLLQLKNRFYLLNFFQFVFIHWLLKQEWIRYHLGYSLGFRKLFALTIQFQSYYNVNIIQVVIWNRKKKGNWYLHGSIWLHVFCLNFHCSNPISCYQINWKKNEFDCERKNCWSLLFIYIHYSHYDFNKVV